jgi:hypothetical protein
MPIPVICACSAKLKVGDHLQGKHVKCPKCGSLLPVGTPNGAGTPAAGAPPAPDPPPSTQAVLAQSPLSDKERDLLTSQLEAGEQVVWADKPEPRIAFLRGWVVTVTMLFSAGSILTILILAGQHGMFSGFSGTITLIALGLFVAGFTGFGLAWPFVARWRAGRTFYAITTERAMAWYCNLFGRMSLLIFEPVALAGFFRQDITAGPDGVGHLIFGSRRVTRKTRHGRELTNRIIRYGFFNIHRVVAVERLLRDTLVDPFLDRLYE